MSNCVSHPGIVSTRLRSSRAAEPSGAADLTVASGTGFVHGVAPPHTPVTLSMALMDPMVAWVIGAATPGAGNATPTLRCASCHLLYVFAYRAEPSASSQTSRYGVGVTTGVGEVRMAVLAVAPASRFRNVTAMIAVLSGSEIVPLIVRI
jgi:hypothetical protein